MFKFWLVLVAAVAVVAGAAVEEKEEVSKSARAPPQFSYDRTADLFGLYVYVEYKYYAANWIVPWNYGLPHYTGTVNPVDEEDIYDPYEKAQLRVFDCGNGWACFESAYSHYYFGLAQLDQSVNFYEEAASVPDHEGYRFKVYCAELGLYQFENCELYAEAYDETWKVYSNGLKFLYYCDTCGDDDWFVWRIKADRPTDATVIEQESECNLSGVPLEQVFFHKVGVDVARGSWDADDPIVANELKANFNYAAQKDVLSENAAWLTEVSNSSYLPLSESDWPAEIIQPNTKLVFLQLRGTYGPYEVYTDKIRKAVASCTSDGDEEFVGIS